MPNLGKETISVVANAIPSNLVLLSFKFWISNSLGLKKYTCPLMLPLKWISRSPNKRKRRKDLSKPSTAKGKPSARLIPMLSRKSEMRNFQTSEWPTFQKFVFCTYGFYTNTLTVAGNLQSVCHYHKKLSLLFTFSTSFRNSLLLLKLRFLQNWLNFSLWMVNRHKIPYSLKI